MLLYKVSKIFNESLESTQNEQQYQHFLHTGGEKILWCVNVDKCFYGFSPPVPYSRNTSYKKIIPDRLDLQSKGFALPCSMALSSI